MNLHKLQLYLIEQHSESFKVWSAIIRINTEGKSLSMKLGPGCLNYLVHEKKLIYWIYTCIHCIFISDGILLQWCQFAQGQTFEEVDW